MKVGTKIQVVNGSYKGRKGIVTGTSTQVLGYIRVKLYKTGLFAFLKRFEQQQPYFNRNHLTELK